jgi:hypothetical protein
MRPLALSLVVLVAAGCGGDGSSDRVTAACGRIVDATCAKFVECKVVESGMTLTAALCSQVRASAISQCVSKEGSGLSAGSDADIDACVQEMMQFQCTNLCGQIPQDPPTCHKLSPSPNTEMITCSQ